MELSDIEIKPAPGDAVSAELRGDCAWGDHGYWIIIGGWGGSETEAREQIDVLLGKLGLDTDKIGNVV